MANTTGKKFAGRQKGTPNKATLDVIAKAHELKCDPVEFLCYVVNSDSVKLKGDIPDLDQRINAAKELASYMYPKRKAVEHTGKDGEELFNYEKFLKSLTEKK